MTQFNSLLQQGPDRDGETLAPKQAHRIRCAYRVMGEKGLSHLSLQDVADEAGVSKAILPYYFDSKVNLILLTMRWVLARVAQRSREAIADAESAEEKMSAMIDAIFLGPESNRRFYLVFFDFLGYAARSDRFADVASTFHEICNSLYAEVVRLGQEEGVFRSLDSREAATVVRLPAGSRSLGEGGGPDGPGPRWGRDADHGDPPPPGPYRARTLDGGEERPCFCSKTRSRTPGTSGTPRGVARAS